MTHGRYSAYNRGCRCDDCRRAWADYMRSYMRQQRGWPAEQCETRRERVRFHVTHYSGWEFAPGHVPSSDFDLLADTPRDRRLFFQLYGRSPAA